MRGVPIVANVASLSTLSTEDMRYQCDEWYASTIDYSFNSPGRTKDLKTEIKYLSKYCERSGITMAYKYGKACPYIDFLIIHPDGLFSAIHTSLSEITDHSNQKTLADVPMYFELVGIKLAEDVPGADVALASLPVYFDLQEDVTRSMVAKHDAHLTTSKPAVPTAPNARTAGALATHTKAVTSAGAAPAPTKMSLIDRYWYISPSPMAAHPHLEANPKLRYVRIVDAKTWLAGST